MSVQEDLGKIQINDDVIATISSLAAVEVEGIVSIAGGSSLAEVWGGKGLKKGVSVTTDEAANYVVIDLEVNIEYGVDVYKAAHQLQRAVKNAVENMTGLTVKAVNVKISGIVLGGEATPGRHPRHRKVKLNKGPAPRRRPKLLIRGKSCDLYVRSSNFSFN